MVNQEEKLSGLLAYSDTWQALTEAASVDEALTHIGSGQVENGGGEPSAKYPRAVAEEIERERSNKATRTFAGRGALLLTIEAQPPDDTLNDYDAQRTWFKEQI